MDDLTYELQRYIVKQLACDTAPETVAERLASQFLVDVSSETVARYDPEVARYDPESEGATELSEPLRQLYYQTRNEYVTEASDAAAREFTEVATTDVFADRSIHCIEEKGQAIALIQHDGTVAALANRCTHQGGPLCEGTLADGTIECPWHGARFEVATGTATGPPAPGDVPTYDVRVRDGAIEVKL